MLINSDIEVTERWLTPITTLMDSDKQIAACQPKLLDYNNRNKFEYAGASGGYIDNLGYPFCRGRIFGSLEEDCGQYIDTAEVFWATGGCIFVRTDAFLEVDGFDEDYFLFFEETDFCIRAKKIGARVVYIPKAVTIHYRGESMKTANFKKI